MLAAAAVAPAAKRTVLLRPDTTGATREHGYTEIGGGCGAAHGQVFVDCTREIVIGESSRSNLPQCLTNLRNLTVGQLRIHRQAEHLFSRNFRRVTGGRAEGNAPAIRRLQVYRTRIVNAGPDAGGTQPRL
jgi:hypothetical protein